MRPFLTVWIEWFAHKFGIQLPVSPSAPFLVCVFISVCLGVCVSFVSAGWQVDKGEDVVLDEAGETQEYRVQEETHEAQTSVQRPLIEVHSQNLDRQETGRWTKGLQLSSCCGFPHA